MTYRPLLTLGAVVAFFPVALAEEPAAGKSLTETDLLKQLESLTPGNPTAPALPTQPTRTPGPQKRNDSSAVSLFDSTPGDPLKLGEKKDKPAEGAGDATDDTKSKGPTEITALEANMDQKANIAIFLGEVVVKDPEFNCICDKLTAWLKHEAKPKPGAAVTTPKPATPRPATPSAKGGADPAKKDSGLDHALAETTSDRRVIITQDKVDSDGTMKHSIGKGDRATYDANTGVIVLYGWPDVVQGTNHVQATAQNTVISLTRDGQMNAVGPHKTTIVDTSRDTSKSPDGSTPGGSPRPAATPRQ